MSTQLVPRSISTPTKLIAAGARAVLRHFQLGSPRGAVPSTLPKPITPSVPAISDAAAAQSVALGCTDHNLVRYAWNGSIPEGALRTLHQERLSAVATERAANAALHASITNRLAALEAELSVLVEQPPKAPPQPKVLHINPIFRGA